MKKWFTIILVLALPAGCTAGQGSLGSNPTVEDIFQPPSTAAHAFTTAPTSTQTDPPYNAESLKGGGCGLTACYENVDRVAYSGGEMCLSYRLELEGDHISRDGVGILLLLDGKPQPYRLEEDQAYQ